MSNSNPGSFQSARSRSERLSKSRRGSSFDNPQLGSSSSLNSDHIQNNDGIFAKYVYGSSRGSVPLSNVIPGSIRPEEAQLDVAYGYAIRRDDGSYTRLVPVDELNRNIPYRDQVGPEGLIILPSPRQPPPSSRETGTDVMVPVELLDYLPEQGQSYLPRGARVDTNNIQHSIDNIIARSSFSPSGLRSTRRQTVSRREKIYCDKWIHDGVCAFTQLGCKYKHEMPMDRATQLSLGLTHGLPNWYRRTYGALVSNSPQAPAYPTTKVADPPSPSSDRVSGLWRRIEAGPSSSSPTKDSNDNSQPVQSYGSSFTLNSQQPRHSQSGYFASKPHSMLDIGDGHLSQHRWSPRLRGL